MIEDKTEDRVYDDVNCGKKVQGLYGYGWFDGIVKYYNQQLKEYVLEFSDNTSDYVTIEDFDGIELMFINT